MTLIDARPLRLIGRYRIRIGDHARRKSEPCRCDLAPHPFCWSVTCRCDHGIGAR